MEEIVFTGMCDASAAVSLDDDLFAVANDEDNVLRFYRLSQPGAPVHTHSLNLPSAGKKKSAELDLEGAARLGGRYFWITSHGQNAKGEYAPDRHRLFALEINSSPGGIRVRRIGTTYASLIRDMSRDPRLAQFKLDEAAREDPKDHGGLSIEGLTDTPEGTLLIGFRNPIPNGLALIVPLLNPNELVMGDDPRFGEPILLDLGGLGLRGMGSTKDGYYLIAGPARGHAGSQLYFWKGDRSVPERIPQSSIPDFNPEGMCFHDSGAADEFLILSDDGSRNVNGMDCKDLPESQRRFRALRVKR